MGVNLELWFKESGKAARELRRRYEGFKQGHPHLNQAGSTATSLVNPNRSTYEELGELLEPGVEGFEDLVYALDEGYDENALNQDLLEEESHYE